VKLKPCPFCGSDAALNQEQGAADVMCSNFQCRARVRYYNNAETAAGAWNKRTWEPTPEQMAEMGNLDGPLSRGQIHPVDYIKAVLAVGGEPFSPWLPIETAPTDGDFLVWPVDDGIEVTWRNSKLYGSKFGAIGDADPTHWHPLPIPPRRALGGEP